MQPAEVASFLLSEIKFDDRNPSNSIRNLTLDTAKAIYQIEWWDKYNYGDITSQILATKVFDLSVNIGNVKTIKLL